MKARQSVLRVFMKVQGHSVSAQGLIDPSLTNRYFFAVFMLFAVQGMVALLGALDFVIPDLPSPIPFAFGRSIHLGLAVLWPLIGTMGMVFYFVPLDLNHAIFSPRLVRWQFWLVFLSALAIYSTLALGIGNGKEYLEGLPVLYLGVAASLTLASYNLLRTVIKAKQISPAVVSMTSGIIAALIFLVPNAFNYSNPVLEDSLRFWVVHLWEEMAFELTTIGFIAAYFTTTGLATRKDVEKLLYLELIFAAGSGLFGTGHHYYWIGLPSFWLWVGTLFSFLQLIPVFMLVHLAYKVLKGRGELSRGQKLGLWLVLSSLFYHLTGAALLGFFIAIPWINLYTHGTFITSAHAHLALFGSLGFLVLGAAFYCLTAGTEPDKKTFTMGKVAILLLNSGLLTMGSALTMIGTLESYLYRMMGLGFSDTMIAARPYFMVRALGGLLFTSGDLLLVWTVLKLRLARRKNQIRNGGLS